MKRSLNAATGSLLLCCVLAASDAVAEPGNVAESNSVITAGTDSSGRIAVNASAGDGNAQTNMAALANGGAYSMATLASRQQAAVPDPARPENDRSAIGADAFRHASGIVSINQSSGNANLQANLAGVANGSGAEVSIEQLGSVTATNGHAAPAATPGRGRTAVIADSAFVGARGLVQINQLAGSGNSTANIFALTVTSGPQ